MALIPPTFPGVRWLVLFSQCALAGVNGYMWANYVPVPKESESVLSLTHSNINNLLLVYTVIWAPCMPISMPLQSATGPFGALVVGGVLNLIGALLKVFGLLWSRTFAMSLIAQTFCGAAEVFFLPLPPLIASTWFPEHQRTLCTALGSLCNSIGIALGYATMPRLVAVPGWSAEQGFMSVFLGQAAFSVLALLLVVVLPRRPLNSPSKTATKSIGGPKELFEHLKSLAKNFNYVLFMLVTGLSLAVGWSSAGMLPQILKPFGVDEDNAGIMGSLFTLCGVFGQFASGRVGDMTRAHLNMIRGGYILSTVFLGLVPLCVGLHANAVVIGYIAVPLLGIAFVGTLPAMYEMLVELSHPCPVAVAVGTQMLISRILFSPVVNPVGSAVLGNHPTREDSMKYLFIFVGMFAACSIGAVVVRDDRRRQAEELRLLADDSQGVNDDDTTVPLYAAAADTDDVPAQQDVNADNCA